MHNIVLGLTATVLAGLLVVNSAWAEGKGKARAETCKIENRIQEGYSPPKVIEFGDLKIKVVEEVDGAGHYAVFDLKAPGYIKRGVRLTEGAVHSDTICGMDVSIQMRGASQLLVSSF